MISAFRDGYRFLSNFWPAKVELDWKIYSTVEHAYQAAKTLDPDRREAIRNCLFAGEAKKMGRYCVMRNDWDDVKLQVMEDLLRKKFSVEPLRTQLFETWDHELVEGNNWNDTFWGKCSGVGENHLGKLLMKIRSEIS